MPATWEFLVPLAEEVAELFPFGMIDLGADEAPHGAWSGFSGVATLKAREGLPTPEDVQV